MEFTQRHLRVVEVLFTALAAYEAALGASSVMSSWVATAPSVSLAALPDTHLLSHPALDAAALALLFGQAPPPPPARPPPPEVISDAIRPSTLHAQLEGTVAGSVLEYSWAVIHDLDASRIEVLLVGDAVFDGELIEVGDGYVLIARPSGVERLDLGGVPLFAPLTGDAQLASSLLLERTGNTLTLSEADRQRLLANPAAFVNEVRARPHLEQGVLKGFLVDWLKPDSLLATAGLRGGDIVSRVNGMELNSAESALGILAQARTASRLEIELVRSGQPTTFVVEVRGP